MSRVGDYSNYNEEICAALCVQGAKTSLDAEPASRSIRRSPSTNRWRYCRSRGNIVQKDGKPRLHAHVVVGKSDGTAHGGHFLGGRVWPTLEIMLSELPVHLRRRDDAETGLALIELAA